jgi:uncharacterized cupredoxin-like copper-binding protein
MSSEQRPSSSRLGILVAFGLCLAGLALATSAAAQNTTQITVEAREDCPDTTFCFAITGSVDNVEPGDQLDITLENPENNFQEHNLYLALSSEANVGEDEATQGRVAFANTGDVQPGNETTLSAEIPEDAENVYLWCTVRAHETQGMNQEIELAGVEEEGTNGSPSLGLAVTVAAVFGMAALTRRR